MSLLIIELNGKKYEEGGNHYDGDILLMPVNNDSEPDMIIFGGYKDLEDACVSEHGYYPKGSDSAECDSDLIESYTEAHLEAYIIDHFKEAIILAD